APRPPDGVVNDQPARMARAREDVRTNPPRATATTSTRRDGHYDLPDTGGTLHIPHPPGTPDHHPAKGLPHESREPENHTHTAPQHQALRGVGSDREREPPDHRALHKSLPGPRKAAT